MESVIYIFILVLLYLFLFISIVKYKNSYVIALLFIYNIFYDWIFIHIIDGFGENIITSGLKLIYEVFLVYLFITLIVKKKRTTKISVGIKYIIVVLFYGIIISLLNGDGLSDILSGVRIFIEPIIAGYLFFANGYFSHLKIKKIYRFLSIVTIALFLMTLYQYYAYKTETDLWFYNYMSKYKKLDFGSNLYNYFRDDSIRASSFFVSPIDASLIYSFLFIFFFMYRKISHSSYVMFSICLLSVLLSKTRIGLVVIFIFLGISILRRHRVLSCLIPLLAITFTFITIIFGYTDEPSALGRIPQYLIFYNDFKPLGYGIGNENSLVVYDSYLLSVLYAFGICGIFLFYFFYKYYKFSVPLIDKSNLIFYVYVLLLSSIYIISFQFFAGNSSYKYLIIMFFIAYANIPLVKDRLITNK